jgi:hypothetical protein
MAFKELLTLGILGGGAYYLLRGPAPAPRRTSSVTVTPASQRKRGRGKWHQKEGGCTRYTPNGPLRCSVGWENTSVSPTGWADSEVTEEAYKTLPDRVESLAKLKKMPGVLRVVQDT